MVLLCSVCDIVTKKIFSTFARGTTQSNQVPNCDILKKRFNNAFQYYADLTHFKSDFEGSDAIFCVLFQILSCFDFGVYFEMQINLP